MMSYRFDPMECILCSRRFRTDVNEKKPVITSCGHNACQKCADTNWENYKRIFSCRKCKLYTTTSEMVDDDFVVNGVDISTMKIMEHKTLNKPLHVNFLPDCSICKDLMRSSGEKIPKTISCGHSFCRKCLLEQQEKNPDDKCCPECHQQTFTSKTDHFPTNFYISDFLHNIESSHPTCERHSGQFLFVVCLDCKYQHFCETCIEEGHRDHRTMHSTVAAAELRELIEKQCQKRRALSKTYRDDSDKLLDIIHTFDPAHRDFVPLANNISCLWSHTGYRGLLQERYEMETLHRFCKDTKAKWELERQETVDIANALDDETEPTNWRNCSDFELVSRTKEIKNWLKNSPTQKPKASTVFEKERLANHYTFRTHNVLQGLQIEFKKPFYLTVTVKSRNAENVFGRFWAWISRPSNPFIMHIHNDYNFRIIIFYFQENKFILDLTQPEELKRDGFCYFSENNTENGIRTIPVDYKNQCVYVNGTTKFSDVTGGWVFLLKLLKSGLPLHD